MKPEISIIVITKNEEKTIENCLKELNKIRFIKKEIILVDSNSSDSTRKKASKYVDKIINIKKSNVYSPSAGRHIGLKFAKSNYIFFVDGDQIVNLYWFKKYYTFIKQGIFEAVTGRYINIPQKKSFKGFSKISLHSKPLGSYKMKLSGTSLIKNPLKYLKENFDPHMKGEEERDFAYRISKKGYRIFKSDEICSAHFVKKEDILEVAEKIEFYQGVGQIIKRYALSRFFPSLLFAFWRLLLIVTLIISIILSLYADNFNLLKIFLAIYLFIILAKNKFKINVHLLIIFLKSLILPVKIIQGIIYDFIKPKFKYSIETIK